MSTCKDCGFALPARTPRSPGRPRRRCVGCVRRRRTAAERRRRSRRGADLGLSPAAWAALRLTDELLDHVAKHGVAASEPDDPDVPQSETEEDLS